MAAPRGKRIALIAAGGALLALTAGGVASWGRLREEWYLWRLSSADEATRYGAVDMLGELRSTRAVPELIRLLCNERGPCVVFPPDMSRRMSGSPPFQGAKGQAHMDPLSYALSRIGADALPLLRQEQDRFPGIPRLIMYMETAGSLNIEAVRVPHTQWPPSEEELINNRIRPRAPEAQ